MAKPIELVDFAGAKLIPEEAEARKIKKDIQVFDLLQLICKVDIEILEHIGADAIPLLFEPQSWKYWEFEKVLKVKIPAKANLERTPGGDTVLLDPNSSTIIAKMPDKGFYFDTVHHPLQCASSLEEIDRAG